MVSEKILDSFSRPFQLGQSEVTVSTSIGISIYPHDGDDATTLLKNSDIAMYNAKMQGRNNFQFFTVEMNKKAMERMQIENELRKALENEEFVLYYQPFVNLNDGKIIGCEALIRWQPPGKGMVAPDVFIPIAEESGLIVEIGEWVINEACRQCMAWQQHGHSDLNVAVNLSARQFIKKNLLGVVKKAISASGVNSKNLELELTESMIMEYAGESIEELHALSALGVQLSIDDFGTGYSSLSYLKKFPLNKLKIDRSFVADLGFDADDAAIVEATIVLGHALNLTVIAEGVETSQQLQFLKNKGCDEMQGYYFSRPVPAEEFEKLLLAGQTLDLAS